MAIKSWSTTAASNATADSGISLNGSTDSIRTGDDRMRSIMQRVKIYASDTNGSASLAGASNAFTYTSAGYNATPSDPFTAYATGDMIKAKANFTTTGASTLNVDVVGAKPIKILVGSTERDTGNGTITEDDICTFVYDAAANSASGAWILENISSSGYVLAPGTTPTAAREITYDTTKKQINIGDGSATNSFSPHDWELITVETPSSADNIILTDLGSYSTIIIDGWFTTSATSAAMYMVLSADNGSSYITNSDHSISYIGVSNGSAAPGLSSSQSAFNFIPHNSYASALQTLHLAMIERFNIAYPKSYTGTCGGKNQDNLKVNYMFSGDSSVAAGSVVCNALKIYPSTGKIATGKLRFYGIRS